MGKRYDEESGPVKTRKKKKRKIEEQPTSGPVSSQEPVSGPAAGQESVSGPAAGREPISGWRRV